MKNKLFMLLVFPILTAQAGNWLQAKLKYTQLIDGKDYPAEVILLRPESYFTENKATKSGDQLTVNLPEMGLADVAMDIVSIESFKGVPIKEDGLTKYKQINEINWDNKTNRPVTGTFKRYAKEVYTYKFRNIKTGELSTINATPNHPFYVVNKHDYVPISEIRAKDKLLSQTGEQVQLICTAPQTNCGTRYNPDNAPTLVYNFEVYQQHRYYVANKGSKQGLLVHNPYTDPFGNNNFLDLVDQPYTINGLKYVKNSVGFLQTTEMEYIYRADTRRPKKILSIGQFPQSLSFADGSSMFDNEGSFPALIGSATYEGAKKFGMNDLDADSRFYIYKIKTRGKTVASLNATVLYTDKYKGTDPDNIFQGSYTFNWDEVHVPAPISLNDVSLVGNGHAWNAKYPGLFDRKTGMFKKEYNLD